MKNIFFESCDLETVKQGLSTFAKTSGQETFVVCKSDEIEVLRESDEKLYNSQKLEFEKEVSFPSYIQNGFLILKLK